MATPYTIYNSAGRVTGTPPPHPAGFNTFNAPNTSAVVNASAPSPATAFPSTYHAARPFPCTSARSPTNGSIAARPSATPVPPDGGSADTIRPSPSHARCIGLSTTPCSGCTTRNPIDPIVFTRTCCNICRCFVRGIGDAGKIVNKIWSASGNRWSGVARTSGVQIHP